MRCLAYYDSAALAFPSSAPRVGPVVSRFPPAEHCYYCEHWFTQLARIDCIFHPLHGLIPTTLADDSQLDSGGARGCNRLITRDEINSERLFRNCVNSSGSRYLDSGRVLRMLSADR